MGVGGGGVDFGVFFPLGGPGIDIGLDILPIVGEGFGSEIFFFEDADIFCGDGEVGASQLENDPGVLIFKHEQGKGVALVHHPLGAVGEIDGEGIEESGIENVVLFGDGTGLGRGRDEEGKKSEDEEENFQEAGI